MYFFFFMYIYIHTKKTMERWWLRDRFASKGGET